jgi:hypothetical protein
MLTTPTVEANPSAPFSCEPTNSASSKPHTPRNMQRYAPAFEGRWGRVETTSDLYVLVEPHIDRLEMPRVLRRRIPPAISIDRGDPHFGHLKLSPAFVAILGISDLGLRLAHHTLLVTAAQRMCHSWGSSKVLSCQSRLVLAYDAGSISEMGI